MRRLRAVLVAAGAVVMLVGVGQIVGMAQSKTASSVMGVWRVAEITRTGPEARKNTSPQPGLFIFTGSHYAIEFVTSDAPRLEVPAEKPTDKQIADAWGPFTANAGTYTLTANELKNTVMVAKNPNVMKTGGFQVFTVKMEGKNTLWLTQKANQNGPAQNPTTLKLTRIE
jgi:hypothetical protein